MLKLLPLLLDVQVLPQPFHGARQPPEQSSEIGHHKYYCLIMSNTKHHHHSYLNFFHLLMSLDVFSVQLVSLQVTSTHTYILIFFGDG